MGGGWQHPYTDTYMCTAEGARVRPTDTTEGKISRTGASGVCTHPSMEWTWSTLLENNNYRRLVTNLFKVEYDGVASDNRGLDLMIQEIRSIPLSL